MFHRGSNEAKVLKIMRVFLTIYGCSPIVFQGMIARELALTEPFSSISFIICRFVILLHDFF